MADRSDQRQPFPHQNPTLGVAPSAYAAAATAPYQAATVSSPTSLVPPQPLGYHQSPHFQNQLQQQQQQQLQAFWASQMQEAEGAMDFKNHSLPLARIKKIMKADEDVRMISAEAPVVFAKACEMFILELTLRSWIHTEENKRRTLQKNDIAAAISRTDVFDFLVDIIPRDELKEEGLGIAKAASGIPLVGSPGETIPYYYVPQQAPTMMAGKAGEQAGLYGGQQPQTALPFMSWPQTNAPGAPPPHQHQHQHQHQPSDS